MQLRTERCLLRPFASSDRERLALIANDRSISRNLTDAFPYPYTLEDADDWIEATSRHDPPRHFAIEVGGELVVDDLNALRTVLEEAGVEVVVDEALPGFDRFYASDPFGNRLEFLQTRPSPPEAQGMT